MHLHFEPNVCSPPPRRVNALHSSSPFSLVLRPLFCSPFCFATCLCAKTIHTHAIYCSDACVASRHSCAENEGERNKEQKGEKEREERRGWLIHTCVMTIADHLLNGADTSLPANHRERGSFKPEPSAPSLLPHTLLILFDSGNGRDSSPPPVTSIDLLGFNLRKVQETFPVYLILKVIFTSPHVTLCSKSFRLQTESESISKKRCHLRVEVQMYLVGKSEFPMTIFGDSCANSGKACSAMTKNRLPLLHNNSRN